MKILYLIAVIGLIGLLNTSNYVNAVSINSRLQQQQLVTQVPNDVITVTVNSDQEMEERVPSNQPVVPGEFFSDEWEDSDSSDDDDNESLNNTATSDLSEPPIAASTGNVEFISTDGSVPQDQMENTISDDSVIVQAPSEASTNATSLSIVVPTGNPVDGIACRTRIYACEEYLINGLPDWANYFR